MLDKFRIRRPAYTPGEPLPPLESVRSGFTSTSCCPDVISAYKVIRDVEVRTTEQAEANLVAIRTLGYLLLYPISQQAVSVVVADVLACYDRSGRSGGHGSSEQADSDKLYELGTSYLRHLVLLFRGRHGPYPPMSDDSSRPPLDVVRDEYRKLLSTSPTDYSTARKQALLRDDFRCIITRVPDIRFISFPLPPGTPRPDYTECCHIFPALSGINAEDAVGDEQWIVSVWELLDRIGYGGLQKELSGANVNRLDNVMTLSSWMFGLFDSMEVWFEEMPTKRDCYQIKLAPRFKDDYAGLGLSREVQFHHVLGDEEGLEAPLPNPAYLRLHAACCRIAHAAGAVEYVKKMVDEKEEIQVLDRDGGSSRVLEFVLRRLGGVPSVSR
ncbi:hypothetical protein L227DRAFT_581433 [Lentinus tigrinus ALCF2SS1-6]|uniref:Uncharacterized protein n=1 Tax=Lentinus tigrinus ALCF2SS1-6 TaxID=1328759 RepID=A0A5C2RNV3_9APHY|nr:hypothetical protein L227DRAFT_581433 [Lentinus tigrinus ALCF2SS1-6]